MTELINQIFGQGYEFGGGRIVFVSNFKNILNHIDYIKVYEKQRSLNEERVEEIVKFLNKDYYERKMNLIVPGEVQFAVILGEETFYLIDGQHRFFAAKRFEGYDFNIMTSVWICNNKEEIWNLFTSINKGVPVPIHYLSPNNILDATSNELRLKYPSSFVKDMKKYFYYHMNIDELKDECIKQRLIEQCGIETKDELLKLFSKTNKIIKGYRFNTLKVNFKSSMNKLATCKLKVKSDNSLTNLKMEFKKYPYRIYFAIIKPSELVEFIIENEIQNN